MIIAIDGTSGSGKSTLAKKVAEKLGFGFFSAGALYRAITYKVLNLHINENDDETLKTIPLTTKIVYTYDGSKNVMILDGIDVTDKLYSEEISNFSSKVSCKPYIREFVRSLQRATKEHNENIVMEGRDIGYKKLGEDVPLEKVIADLEDRDYKDIHRAISPLVMCSDALLIDTSNTSTEECMSQLFREMLRRNIATPEFFAERGIDIN